jgi:hypothetical protein
MAAPFYRILRSTSTSEGAILDDERLPSSDAFVRLGMERLLYDLTPGWQTSLCTCARGFHAHGPEGECRQVHVVPDEDAPVVMAVEVDGVTSFVAWERESDVSVEREERQGVAS